MKILSDNEYHKITLENGIVIQTFKLDTLDLKTTQKLVEDRIKAFGDISYPLIANIRSLKHSSKKAREFFASDKGCERLIAAALIVDSPLGSMIGNFFVKITDPVIPAKVFSNVAEAKRWLEQYVAKI